MQFKFWGVRGSIPVPGPDTLSYGGNTTCIEVRGKDRELIILDAGTGIFQLGQELVADNQTEINIFITHTHWDHIQGLPMFQPSFLPTHRINIYGARDLVSGLGIRERLAKQMDRHFFPIQLDSLASDINFYDLEEGSKTTIGSLTISSFQFNHPIVNFGYRVESSQHSLVFTGDHEWMFNSRQPSDDKWEETQKKVDRRTSETLDFIKNTDVLIIDTAYTSEEYETKRGWGHGTFDSSIQSGREADVKNVYLTHHEPTRTDEMLEKAFLHALKQNHISDDDPDFFLAREGQQVDIK